MVLNEKTLLPISAVAVVIGATLWLSTVFAQVNNNGKALDELSRDQKAYLKHVQLIDRRLSNIEGRLGLNLSKEE